MGQLAGILGAADNTILATIGPTVVSDAVNDLLARYQIEQQNAFSFWVEEQTTDWKTVYTLVSGDEMQELGQHDQPIEKRVTGSWETAYPIKRYGDALGWDYETFQYMTVADMERQTASKTIANAKTHRRQIMRALFGNVNYIYTNPQDGHGALTIRRLANGDGTTYPPLLTGTTEADEDHYLISGYAAASISDANNPLATMVADLKHHWDGPYLPVAHINSAQRNQIAGLSLFVDAVTPGVRPASTDATVDGQFPDAPGEFIGIDPVSGVYVYVWDQVPANYITMRDYNKPAPLKKRVHAVPSLVGFRLEAEAEHHPLYRRTWMDRFGYAAGNRLNGTIMFLDAGSVYVVPATYA